MAENTNYIGVSMGLDVSDLKAGLNETSKMIGKANAEFRSSTAGLEDWSKSIEGISAKVTQLDTVLDAQKRKLAGLTAEYEKVAKEQGENSVAAKNLYIKMKNQEAVVKTTEREYKNYKDTLDRAKDGTLDLENATLKAGKAVDKMGNEAEESGRSLDGLKSVAGGVVKGVAAIGTAVVALVGGFLSLAESTREAREDMTRLTSAFEGAKLSGESANKTFKTLYGVIGETDTAVEAAQQIALLASSEEEAAKWAEQAANVTATFGDALKPETFFEAANETLKLGEATGAYTQMLEGTGVNVDDFNAHLGSLNTEQEKQAYLLEVSEKAMGKAGDAYNETAKDIIEAREAEAELSMAMQELGAIAEPIMTALKLLAVDLLETVKPFVELIGEGLSSALNGSAEGANLLAEGLTGILMSLSDKLTSLLPAVGQVLVELVQKLVSSLLENAPMLFQAATDLVVTLAEGIASMLPTLIPQAINAILTLVQTLLSPECIDRIIDAAIMLVESLADGLLTALPDLVAKIPVIIDSLISAVKRNLPKLLRSGMEVLFSLRDGLMEALPQLVAQLPQIISSIVSGLLSMLPELIALGGDLLAGLMKGMLDPKAIWNGIKSLGKGIIDGFKKFFEIKSPSRLMKDEIGQYLGTGVGVGLVDSIPTVKKQLVKFSDFITDNLGGIKAGLDISATGGVKGSSVGVVSGKSGSVINAPLTVNYNGSMSRRQIKQLENDNYTAIRLKLVKEGLI